MDCLADRLNTATGETLSNINELNKKRRKRREEAEENDIELDHTANLGIELPNRPFSRQIYPSAPGIPFGGDTFTQTPPPPIGFRTDLVNTTQLKTGLPSDFNQNQPQPNPQSSFLKGTSEQSLYDGDAWTRLWFQRAMLLSLIRLLLFVRKVYEDYLATKSYRIQGQIGHFLISAAALFLPTIIFTLYRVSRYLQIALPPLRRIKAPNLPAPAALTYQPQILNTTSIKSGSQIGGDDPQVRKALIEASGSATQASDEDGLVTARGTPTNLHEEYHDSISQQHQTSPISLDGKTSPAPSTTVVKGSPTDLKLKQLDSVHKESIDINKFGNLPDKETTRVVIGASEQILHGVLFIFWQLKRQVDVLGYLVERSCLWRKPRELEKEELGRLRIGSDGLEWFQDFYAAFLAILVQVYTLAFFWSTGENFKSSKASTLNSAGALGTALNSDSSGIIAGNIPKAANAINQQLAGGAFEGKDLFVLSELIVSSAVVISLLFAVRRRDDGPLTSVLSFLGWGSIFSSRVIVIALAFIHIKWQIMLALVVCHIFGMTGWIYKIALDSHNGKKGESEETVWLDDDQPKGIELETGSNQQKEDQQNQNIPLATSEWSILEHIILLSQTLTLFALPSLFYWPVMFNLKLHYRPFKYLVLILLENFLLMVAIWIPISSITTQAQWYLLGAVGSFSIVGFLFISLYIACKPSLTEYFARYDELYNDAENSGIYYEFCSRVFKMPDLSKHAFSRLTNQEERVETIDTPTIEVNEL